MKPKVTQEKLEQLWGDSANWKAGLFYSCHDDPRVVVPKKQKWRGWTLNFAHRSAIPTCIIMVLIMGLPQILLAVYGLVGTPVWCASSVLTIVIVCLACWYLSSPSRYTKH